MRHVHKDRIWPSFFLIVVIVISISCGGPSPSPVPTTLPPAVCDPSQATEVVSVTIQNNDNISLQNYVVAITLDKSSFDFNLASADGSNLAVWDSPSHTALPFWLESYDPQIGKAVLWVKIANLVPQAVQSVLVTVGATPHCVAQLSNGHSVFPFFNDVQDAGNWTTANHLSVTNFVTKTPLAAQNRQVIVSDGMYNSTPGVAQAANGDWVLAYRKGTAHVHDPLVVLRRSQDQGATWGPEAVYWDTSGPDPTPVQTPNGDLLIEFVKLDANSDAGAAYSRSTDNGLTWAPFTFFSQPPDQTSACTALFNSGATMYGVGYGPSTFDTNFSPSFWQSIDDGLTWTMLSSMREASDPGMNETAGVQIGPNTMFAMMRADDSLHTYGRYSNDQGHTWGPLNSYTTQVGIIQDPVLVKVGNALMLLGRESMPPSVTSNASGYTRQFVAFVSYDGGQTFGYGTLLESYTGLTIDGGYSWPLVLPDGRVYVVYYADSNNLRQPDIKSLILSLSQPETAPADAMHIVSQFDFGQATQNLNIAATRYSLDFRFRSQAIAGGPQFSVNLNGMDANGTTVNLVNWELPSVHSNDPTNISGLFANNQFIPILSAFNYDQTYRVRTIVDETQQQQEGQVLDQFGIVLNTSGVQPLAQQAAAHATSIVVGNNTNLRTTDTLLDFIFVRPIANLEPAVTVSRIH